MADRGTGFGPSVLDGRLRYVSVSQIEKFDPEVYGGCERRWWLRYVGGRPEPSIKAQRLGTQVHAQIEHYLRTGQDVLGELARAGKRFLPDPQTVSPGLEVETAVGGAREHFPGGAYGPIDSELDVAGVPVVGFVDALDARASKRNDAGETLVEPGVVEVVDWKTTKRIDDEVDSETGLVVARGLAKTAEEIGRSHQMVNYGELAARRYPWAKAVRLSHGVFQTTGPRKAVKRSDLVPIDELRRRRGRSEAVVERMKGVAAEASVSTVTANLASCSAYGGCPHRGPACPRDPKQVLASLFGGAKTMSLLEKFRQKQQGSAPPPAEPTDKYLADKAAAGSQPSAWERGEKDAVAAETEKLQAEEAAIRAAASVTPPDAPEPSRPKAPEVAQAAPPTEPTPEPTKKARKAKSAEAPAVSPATPTASSAPAGIVLHLNCVEDGVAYKRLDAYAHGLADALAEKFCPGSDIRCPPSDSPLTFGKWKGALAALAKEAPPPDGVYVGWTSDEIVDVVANALAPRARVTRGRP